MKKIKILLLSLISFSGFSQSKSTGVITLTSNMTANFTLNNTTSKVTLVLTGPSDRWFAIGIGVNSGFGMSSGDLLTYTTTVTDRNYVGFVAPATDASQDWSTISNTVASGVRTLTLERALTNADTNDYQLPYTTASVNLAWARANTASTTLAGHGSSNRGFAIGSFLLLGTENFNLESSSIFPNPSNGNFVVKTNSNLTKINIYSQTGSFVKTIEVGSTSESVEIDVKGLQSGIYLLELQNETDKAWKKIIVK